MLAEVEAGMYGCPIFGGGGRYLPPFGMGGGIVPGFGVG